MHQHLSNIAIDELGESLIDRFYTEHPNNSLCVDIEGFATDFLGLTIRYETFEEKGSSRKHVEFACWYGIQHSISKIDDICRTIALSIAKAMIHAE